MTDAIKVVKITRQAGDSELIMPVSGLLELDEFFEWKGALKLELTTMTQAELDALPEWDGP